MEMNAIEKKIVTFKRAYFTNELLKGLIRFLGITLLLSLLAIVLEGLGRFTSGVRFWLFWLIVSSAVVLLGRYIIWPLGRWMAWWKPLTHRRIAAMVAHTYPGADDPLLAGLNFGKGTATGLQRAALDQAIRRLQPLRFRRAVDWRSTRRLWPLVVVPVAILLILLAVPTARGLLEGGERIVAYQKEFLPPAPFTFVLTNDSLRVARGDDYRVNLRLEGSQIPASVQLKVGEDTYRMVQKSPYRYTALLPNVRDNRRFQFLAGPYQSKAYQLDVFERPSFQRLRMEVVPPAYTGLRPNVIPFKPNITVPEGSSVRWKVDPNGASRAFMEVNSQKRFFREGVLDTSLVKKMAYRLGIENQYQQLWMAPPGVVSIQVDQRPQAEARMEVDSNLRGNLFLQKLRYSDDYGISKVIRVVQGQEKQYRMNIAVKGDGVWTAMEPLDSLLRDLQGVVEVFFEVYDNDAVNGAKMSRTESFRIRQLSKAEREQLREVAFQNAQQTAKSLQEMRRELQEFTESLREQLMMDNKLQWREQQKLETLLKKLSETQRKGEKLKREVQKAMQNQSQRDSADAYEKRIKELTEEQKELEKLKEEIQKLSEELNREALEQKLQQLQRENKQRLQQEQRLEELMEDLKMQRDILKTAKDLQELAKRQKELSQKEETGEQAKQEDIKKVAKQLQEKMEELKNKNKALSKSLEKASSQQKGQEAQQEMEKALQKMQQGAPQQANPNQKKAGEKMEEMSQDMQKALAQMQQNSLQVNMESLRRILANLEVFSHGVEAVGNQIRALEEGDPRYRKLLQEQERLAQGAKVIEDSLRLLAHKAPEVKEKVFKELEMMQENLAQAQKALQETQRNKAATEHQFSMMAANELALLLDESMKQMMSMMAMKKPGKQNCQKPGGRKPKPGMGQKLMQMGKKIQRLQQGQKPGDKKGKRGLGGKELVKILSEQEQLRRALEEMAKKAGSQGSKGNLQKAAEEMKEIEKDLAQGREGDYRERFQRIQTRLLESKKAELQRKRKKQRQAETAEMIIQSDVPAWVKDKPEKEAGFENLRGLPLEMTRFYRERSQTIR